MKKFFLKCLFSGFTAVCLAQEKTKTLGLVLAPNMQLPDWPEDRLFHFGTGLFYDQDLTGRIGLSTGVRYLAYHSHYPVFFIAAGPSHLSSRLYNKALEIPLNLVVNLNPEGPGKYRRYLLAGYAHRYLISSVHKVEFPDRVITEQLHRPGRNLDFLQTGHFLNFGVEVRRPLGTDFTAALGAVFGYALADQENCLFQLNLKLGRNLGSGKNIQAGF